MSSIPFPLWHSLEYTQDVALYFICFVAPLLIMPVVNFITVRSWWDFHTGDCQDLNIVSTTLSNQFPQVLWDVSPISAVLCFHLFKNTVVLSLALTGAMTQIVKITVGRPRPGETALFLVVCN